ncbi:MAG: response regulator [Sedimentisphaerales bacterium]|nr:response regulator [Sedimentisphaerales bacterium]
MRILLADDDSKIQLIIQLWLKEKGHQVETVRNGRDALDRLQQQPYDVLITDVNMPLLNGIELVRRTLDRPDGPSVIIVLTSRCDKESLRQQLDSPRVHLFNKPFSPAALIHLIDIATRNQCPPPETHVSTS